MKMRKFLALFFLPLLAFATVSDWETLQIDSRTSISFPLTPEKTRDNMWSIVSGNAKNMMRIEDLEKRGVDSASLASIVRQPNVLDAFSKGFLTDEGSSILSKKISSWNGYTVFDYVFNPGKNSQYQKLYAKLIFVGAKTYAPAVFVNDEKLSQGNREKFFNSFRLN